MSPGFDNFFSDTCHFFPPKPSEQSETLTTKLMIFYIIYFRTVFHSYGNCTTEVKLLSKASSLLSRFTKNLRTAQISPEGHKIEFVHNSCLRSLLSFQSWSIWRPIINDLSFGDEYPYLLSFGLLKLCEEHWVLPKMVEKSEADFFQKLLLFLTAPLMAKNDVPVIVWSMLVEICFFPVGLAQGNFFRTFRTKFFFTAFMYYVRLMLVQYHVIGTQYPRSFWDEWEYLQGVAGAYFCVSLSRTFALVLSSANTLWIARFLYVPRYFQLECTDI